MGHECMHAYKNPKPLHPEAPGLQLNDPGFRVESLGKGPGEFRVYLGLSLLTTFLGYTYQLRGSHYQTVGK